MTIGTSTGREEKAHGTTSSTLEQGNHAKFQCPVGVSKNTQ